MYLILHGLHRTSPHMICEETAPAPGGSTQDICRAAGRQVASIVCLHPQQLPSLLKRVRHRYRA